MKQFYALLPLLLLVFGPRTVAAQCGTNVNTGVCYSQTNAVVPVAVDVCPTSPTDLVTVTFTAGYLEGGFDNLQVYEGPAGSGHHRKAPDKWLSAVG